MSTSSGSSLSSIVDDAVLIDRLGESVPGLLYVYDLVERRNVYTNRALAAQLGYSPAEVQAMGDSMLATIVHPEDLAFVLEHHRRMSEWTAPEPAELEYRVRAASGEWIWLHSWETILTREPDGRSRLMLGIAQDVTARVATDAALRDSERRRAESEQRWRSIVENPFDFVVVIDRDYRFTFVNFTAPGVTEEDLIGKATPLDYVPAEYQGAMRAALAETFATGRPTSYEAFVPIANQWLESLVGPIRDGDVVTHVSILTRDITVEKVTQAQARRAEQRLRLAIQGAEEVLFSVGLEDGEAFLAPHLLEILELPPGELTLDVFGPKFMDQLHPDDREAVSAARLETLERGVPFSVEFRLRTRPGGYRWFEGRGRVVREPGEQPHFAGFLTDETERRARQDELERKHRELEQALETQRALEAKLTQSAKLEAVGRLAGGIAHDFNNLLTGVSGVADLLEGALGPSSPLLGEIRDLQQTVTRGAGLTRQLLAFSRQQVITPTVLDVAAQLGTTTRLLSRLIGEDIEVKVAAAPDLWPIRADASQIEQVLMNLAVNARDAMPRGGILEFEASNVVLDAEHCLTRPDARPGEFVRLRITDDGAGMDRETLARIFEPFFTTKPLGTGTGLGLATVYGIVRQSDGFIHVHSEPGRGTTFEIHFPRVTGSAAAASAKPELRPAGAETILLVEDEALVLRLVKRILEGLGYVVRTASRGDEALRMVEASLPFDLLLTDVILPGLDGHELYRRAQALRPGIPVVFMSGYTDNLIAEQGLLDTGASFLQKPFVPDELARTVRAALDRDPGGTLRRG